MPESYPFPMYSGLLEPEHYKKIGSAIWLFLWCISSTTKEIEKDGVTWGIVLGNKPLKRKDLAEPFGVSERTVQRWLDDLEKNGYIKVTRAPYGYILTVRNSKKYRNRVDKNVQSEKGDRTKTSSPERTDVSSHCDKNVHSNKDITGDITNKDIYAAAVYNAHEEPTGGVPTTESVQLPDKGSVGQIPGNSSKSDYEQIRDYYMQLAGIRGFDVSPLDQQAIHELLSYEIDINKVLQWMKECFESYQPKHRHDKINSIRYCLPKILDKHYAEQEVKNGDTKVYKYSSGYGRSRKQSKTADQIFKELEESKRAWGG